MCSVYLTVHLHMAEELPTPEPPEAGRAYTTCLSRMGCADE